MCCQQNDGRNKKYLVRELMEKIVPDMIPDISVCLGVAAGEGADSADPPPGLLLVFMLHMVAQIVVLLMAVRAGLHTHKTVHDMTHLGSI
jgi:hypothetical protein